jgi:hypothetical protein
MGCPVTVDCGSPPDGSTGTPYTHTFPTTGGPNLFFSITAGALPPGLTLDPATGIVSGTPTAAGLYSFTVTVIDAQVMAAGDDGSFANFKVVITSDDGSTWARQTTAITDSGWTVIYSAALGLWIVGTDGASTTEQLQTSPDGVSGNWTAVSTPADNRSVYHLESGALSVVAIYKNISNQISVMYTVDGTTWTAASVPAGTQIFQSSDIAYSPELGRFVIVDVNDGSGHAGALYSDDDGATWTFAGKVNNLTSRAVTWGNGLFVSVGGPQGSGEHLQTSPDGINWTVYLSPPLATPGGSAQGLSDVHFANGIFVAVSDDTHTTPGQQAVYSTDGVNWTLASTATKHWTCVTYGYGQWIAGDGGFGSTQPLMSSTDDGATWSLVSAIGFSYGFINGIAFGPLNNCNDSANCSINITGAMVGNTWRGGFQQRPANTLC